jgi:hypothetical protein
MDSGGVIDIHKGSGPIVQPFFASAGLPLVGLSSLPMRSHLMILFLLQTRLFLSGLLGHENAAGSIYRTQ